VNADTLPQLLTARAASHADKVVYATRDGSVTYRELFDEARVLSGALGVASGDRVALIVPAGLDFMKFFWAIQLSGATAVAFNPNVPEETALKRAQRVKPTLIVRDIATVSSRARSRDPLPSTGGGSLDSARDDTLAFLQPTSGTSGESRAVMIRHRNIMPVLRASAEALQISESDVLVSWVPPWHDLGLVRFVIGTVYAGATCHIVQPAINTIPEWLATISEVRGTITGAPDFAIRLAARLVNPAKVDLSSLRYVTNGGEAVRLSTIKAFEERFHVPGVVIPGYGLAEATLGVTCVRPGEPVRTDARGNVCCGTPFPGVEVRVDPSGELLVRGPGVFAGYFEAEEATRAALGDGWLHTGDVGYQDKDGGFYILGRKRAMLKRGGAVLAPRELEEAAQEVPGVKIACAVGVSSEATEEIVVTLESESDPEPLAAAVSRKLQQTLGFAPERVLVVEPRAIPRTYNGKLRHDALRTMLVNGELDTATRYDSRHPERSEGSQGATTIPS
jgi:acyl-CoA synthetase (AMP-forming)/AMP-acid ligase II